MGRRRPLTLGLPAGLAGPAGWCGNIQGGIEAQPGDHRYGLGQGLADAEQVQYRVGAVSHHHYGAMRQPASQQYDHLAGPVGELFVASSPPGVESLRGRQHGEEGQSPVATGPRDVAQPHHGYPAQAAGLDMAGPGGAHSVAVDAAGADARTPAPFNGLVNAEDQRS